MRTIDNCILNDMLICVEHLRRNARLYRQSGNYIADAIGCNRGYFSKIWNGSKLPSMTLLRRWASLYGLELETSCRLIEKEPQEDEGRLFIRTRSL